MMKPRRTITDVLRTSQRRICLIIVIMCGLFLSINLWTTMTYSDFFNGYQSLQEFYSCIEEASDEMKSYLTTGQGALLDDHRKTLRQASKAIQSLENNPVVDEKWRLGLLASMLSSYERAGLTLIASYGSTEEDRYARDYEIFLHRQQLIDDTATTYYNQMTASMSARLDTLKTMRTVSMALSVASALVVIALLSSVTRFFRRSVLAPLSMVFENIRRIQNGNYQLMPPESSSQEIEALYQSLETMARQIAAVRETEKKNAELEKKLAQSEVRMLQNQINPHFLFNTLNTIYCMAEADGAHKAGDMLLKTTHLLRYGLDMQNRISTLSDELKAVQDYITIQKIRLQDKVNFSTRLSLSQEDLRMAVPGMILQPLVENSIKHGLRDFTSGGKIEIQAKSDERCVRLTVSDNGEGMEKEKLDAMLASDFQAVDSHGLGLYNVVHRVQMFYKERAILEFASSPHAGFTVSITIQKQEECS